MKKIIFKGITLCLLLTILTGCESDPVKNETDRNSNSQALNLQTENGVLVFKDYNELEKTNNELQNMPYSAALLLEKEHNFMSLRTIDKMINDAENEHQETFFKGINPNLSVKEYEAKGLFYEPSALYKTYLTKGVIKRIKEADDSKSTALNVTNAAYLSILNEQGKVIVGNEILVFNGSIATVYNRKTNELLKSFDSKAETPQQNLNNQYNFNKGTGSSGSRWIQDIYKGSDYRYYGQVLFSSIYTTSSLSQTFYWEARAEQKKFGNWNTRNDYNPIWGFSGNWSYDYWIIYPNAGFGTVRDGSQYPLPNSGGLPTSPYNLANLNTNYTVRNMQFSAMYSINPSQIGYSYFDNVRVYNYGFTFKFSGGSTGVNYPAQ